MANYEEPQKHPPIGVHKVDKEQPMPCKTPIADLRQMTLEHYEKASNSIHHWMLVIPTAINEYYDRLEQEENKK